MTKPRVAIVDVYAPTRRYGPAFIAAGYDCVRVQSTRTVPPLYRGTNVLGDFIDNIVHDGNLARTVEAIRVHEPVAILAGGELGVELADLLSEHLGTPTNGTALSTARRHKFTMIETVRAAGLRAPDQLLATDEEAIRAWHEQRGGRIVLKPARSAGGDGVTFCDTPDESVHGFRSIMARNDIFALPNESVVAQRYVAGTEYMVNAVSRDGHHRVCDIWRNSRLSANGVSDLAGSLHLISAEGATQDRVIAYTFAVLDALGIRHGPTHTEVRDTSAGPCLIEIAARIPGGDITHYAAIGTGESQIDLTVEAYVDPEKFLSRSGDRYRTDCFVACVALISPVVGVLKQYNHLAAIEELESFHGLRMMVKSGNHIARSVDDTTYPILVDLVHEEEEVVLRDTNTIRWLDGRSFYSLE